jgi:hypothetical protein
MALRNALTGTRLRRAIVVAVVALVVVPVAWQLSFSHGHGSGHSGYGTVFSKP